MTIDQVIREHTMKTLEECEWNKLEAARRLDITIKTLYNWLHRWGESESLIDKTHWRHRPTKTEVKPINKIWHPPLHVPSEVPNLPGGLGGTSED